MLAIIRFIK